MRAHAQEARPDFSAYLTDENREKLDAGKFVVLNERSKDSEGKSRGKGVVLGIIEKPRNDVWSVLTDYTSHPEYLPTVVATEVYSTEGTTTGIKETIKVLWKRVQYHVLQTQDDQAYVLAWRLDKSLKNDIDDTWGHWALLPYGEGKCVAVYSVHVDTGIAVPQFVEDFLMRRDLPDVVRAVKKRAESNGEYKK